MKSEMKLYAVMGAIVALGGGFLVFSNREGVSNAGPQTTPPPPPVTQESFTELERTTRHFKGSDTARFTVIEFADFECPSCRATYDMVLKKLGKEFPQVRFGFRHFPLKNIHPFAEPAAIASEFADKEGKFWEFYEALLEKPKEPLTQELIDSSLKKAGLDPTRYSAAKNDANLVRFVTDDLTAGQTMGVNETPTFFVRDNQTKSVKMVTGWKGLYPELKASIPGLPTPMPSNPNPMMPGQ